MRKDVKIYLLLYKMSAEEDENDDDYVEDDYDEKPETFRHKNSPRTKSKTRNKRYGISNSTYLDDNADYVEMLNEPLHELDATKVYTPPNRRKTAKRITFKEDHHYPQEVYTMIKHLNHVIGMIKRTGDMKQIYEDLAMHNAVQIFMDYSAVKRKDQKQFISSLLHENKDDFDNIVLFTNLHSERMKKMKKRKKIFNL
jgi:hypothetical protein